jgi:hypothetical protein
VNAGILGSAATCEREYPRRPVAGPVRIIGERATSLEQARRIAERLYPIYCQAVSWDGQVKSPRMIENEFQLGISMKVDWRAFFRNNYLIIRAAYQKPQR